ncbi:MAG: STAS domain-containing protein [Cytophagia bacterium]|nr:STAS domain-containing protein [Cytophagia bacterium]NVK83153.1 STAS domain-containing protein [Cytophagia bacterium]
MTFKSSENNGVLVLKIEGNLIGEEVGSGLLDAANDAINDGTVLCAIDIEKVKYINSSGIGVLITLLTKFRNQEGEVVIVNPSEHVKKLLIITKLTAIFKMADSVEQAIQELKS